MKRFALIPLALTLFLIPALLGAYSGGDDPAPRDLAAANVFDWVPAEHRWDLRRGRVVWDELSATLARHAVLEDWRGVDVQPPELRYAVVERLDTLARVEAVHDREAEGITYTLTVEAWLPLDVVATWPDGESLERLAGPVIGVSYGSDARTLRAVLRLGEASVQ